MAWFFRKKKVPEKKREIQVLEQVEERVERREIKLCELAIESFTQAGHECYFTHSIAHQKGLIAINGPGEIRKMLEHIDEAQRHLLNLKGYARKHQKLARRLESDLLDIRDGTQDKKVDFLSTSESRVLSFGRDIARHIQQLVEQLKTLSQHDLNEVQNEGYLNPKNTQLGTQIREEMLNIQRGLNGLHKMLLDLFELEKKVEELTAAYIDG